MISIYLIPVNDFITLITLKQDENLRILLILNWQYPAHENGIRATIELENIEITVIETVNSIDFDIRILDVDNEEYISDEDFTEFEQRFDQEWEDNLYEVPIRFYNDNYVDDSDWLYPD